MKPLCSILCLVFGVSRLWAAEHPLDNNTSGPAHLDSASEDFRRVWKGMLGGDDYLRALKATGMADALAGSRGNRGPTPKDLQTWTRTGPVGGFGNSGDNGRVAGLAFATINGRRYVYAGASSGGLWRSDAANPGAWESLGDRLPNPAVRAFAVNPTDPQRIVVGTGDSTRYKGAGLFVTTNSGATWNTVSLDPNPNPERFYRVFHALNTPQVMVAVSDNGLWRSTTSGDQWTQVEWGDWTDLVLHPTDPNVMYAVATAEGIYKSTNQGVGWTQLSSPKFPPFGNWERSSLAICRDAPDTVAVMVTSGANLLGVYRTSDGGSSWDDITGGLGGVGGGQADHAQALAFRPNNPDELFLGVDKLYRGTRSSGTQFQWSGPLSDAGHDDYTQLVFDPADDNTLWLASDGGLYREPGLGSAQSVNGDFQTGLAISQIDGFDANRSMIALGLQDNGILRTVDAAQTWDRLTISDGASVQITDPEHKDFWFWDGQYKDVPWHPKRAIFGQSIEDLPFPTGCIDMFHYDLRADRVWAVAGQSIYSTAESADPVTWTAEILGGLHRAPNYSLRALWGSKIESGTLAVSFAYDLGADVAVAHKQGGNWIVNLTTSLVPSAVGWVWAVTPSREWPGEWWACLHGRPGDPKIWHTTDYGQTWQNISGVLTNLETVFAVVPMPFQSLTLYAATSLGVFRSVDGGKTWAPFQEGLPIVEVRGMTFVVDPTHTGVHKLRIGTYGRGTWERDIPAPPIIYVDRDNNTGVEDGTLEHPCSTIAKGVAAAPSGAIVAIRANTYTEPQTITNAVTLMTYAGTTVVN